jgi:hypothetical protein
VNQMASIINMGETLSLRDVVRLIHYYVPG